MRQDAHLESDAAVRSIRPTEAERKAYATTGVVALRRWFSASAIGAMRAAVDREIVASRPGRPFSREAKDIVRNDGDVQGLIFGGAFGDVLEALTGRRLRMTQCQGIEMTAGRTGHPWHIGVTSFNFVYPDDFGLTVWIPLNMAIDPDGQDGGLRFVSMAEVDGAERYRAVFDMERMRRERKVLFDGCFIDAEEGERRAMPALAVDPGDAIVFDRRVFHRSATLREGVHDRRLALIIRLVGPEARFARAQWSLARSIEPTEWYDKINPFPTRLDLPDGTPLAQSPLRPSI